MSLSLSVSGLWGMQVARGLLVGLGGAVLWKAAFHVLWVVEKRREAGRGAAGVISLPAEARQSVTRKWPVQPLHCRAMETLHGPQRSRRASQERGDFSGF